VLFKNPNLYVLITCHLFFSFACPKERTKEKGSQIEPAARKACSARQFDRPAHYTFQSEFVSRNELKKNSSGFCFVIRKSSEESSPCSTLSTIKIGL